MDHILTYAVFSPLLGILLISFVPRKFEEGVRAVALTASLIPAALIYYIWTHFNLAGGFVFQETVPWIPSLNINYHVGIDGVSLLLIALAALLVPLCVAVSWNEIKARRKEFYGLLLACEVGLLGTFSALDLFLFYVFWEVMLIPMYFLIGMWGSGNRIYVALKFLLYTMVGSVLMLVGVIYLYIVAGGSFNMLTLSGTAIAKDVQIWLFLAFAIAFAIKVPLFPFHTWLPDAHTEAPTAGSVLLAGVFLKAGTYGLYRIAMPYFPEAIAALRPAIFTLATISIVYGALVSMVQTDSKRLIAYSSVSHLGFVVLGLISLNEEGVQGAVLQMINHGFSTGALFLLFGMLYARAHTRNIADFGGVARIAPIYSGIFVFAGLSSLGLPGLNNFVGEVLVLICSFKAWPAFAIISSVCVIFAAIYILCAIERVFFGEAREESHLKEASAREIALIMPLLIAIVWFGEYPKTALTKITASTTSFIKMAGRNVQVPPREPLDIIMPEIYRGKTEIIMPEPPPSVIPEEVESPVEPSAETPEAEPVFPEEVPPMEEN